jgi:hypothetical protein
MVCACLFVVLLSGVVYAQILTITSAGYVAGPPPKADPQGTYSVPPKSGTWRVLFDYGTVNNGNFTPDLTIGVGGTAAVPQLMGNWGPLGQETLKNPLPANTHVRAQLQRQDPNDKNKWTTQWTAYEPVK